MDTSTLSHHQRQHRMNIRNFLLTATPAELRRELDMCADRPGDKFRAECIHELILENNAERVQDFRRELGALLAKYDACIVGVSGEPNGIGLVEDRIQVIGQHDSILFVQSTDAVLRPEDCK